MDDIFFAFRVNSKSGLVDAMFAFYDEWSRSCFLDEHRQNMHPITGHFVGSSRSRVAFLQNGWTCHADHVLNAENRVYCWRFSSPLLPDKSYWNLEEFLATMKVEAEVWEMANNPIH